MIAILIVAAVLTRFIDHPANVTPVLAIALFASVYLKRKSALIIPLIALLISDYFIGFYEWPVMISVYLSYGLVILIGFYIKKHKSIPAVFGSTILGSILFYLITNFAVWAFYPFYPPTAEGLLTSYVAAIPFFRNALMGNMLYVTVLFGAYEAFRHYREKYRLTNAVA